MTANAKNIVLLGSTGSIGRSTIEVVQSLGHPMRLVALAAHRNTRRLVEQARAVRPDVVVVTDPEAAERLDPSELPAETGLLVGSEAVEALVQMPEVDVVVAAVVGIAGLRATLAALEAGKTVALANKESLVVGGPLVMEAARRHHARLLPVDSEHSAVFQALAAGRREEVRRVVLTASGGPFREMSLAELENVTVEEALAHPTWNMGRKITVDSATLMNKALEIIEARWLFDLEVSQIGAVLHPQSIVHSLVEFVDGSVVAQLSPPDMRLPIQLALTWPERMACPARSLDWTQSLQLDFTPPDLTRFDALALALETAQAGGTSGAVLNAANEVAVDAFLAGRLRFAEIVPLCRRIVEEHHHEADPNLETLFATDLWAREEATRWLNRLS